MPTRKPPPPSPKARRQREYRQRQRDGVSVVRVEAGPVVKKALAQEKWLGKAETGDLGTLADAIYDLLDCWARRTLKPDPTRQGPR